MYYPSAEIFSRSLILFFSEGAVYFSLWGCYCVHCLFQPRVNCLIAEPGGARWGQWEPGYGGWSQRRTMGASLWWEEPEGDNRNQVIVGGARWNQCRLARVPWEEIQKKHWESWHFTAEENTKYWKILRLQLRKIQSSSMAMVGNLEGELKSIIFREVIRWLNI